MKLIIAISLTLMSCVAWPATVTVSPSQSISSGINAASNGDTVHVLPGIYNGSVNVNKAIVLKGDPGAVINGNVTPGNNSTIEGFRVNGGINSGNARRSNVRILNNHTGPASYQLWVNGDNWLVEGNRFETVRKTGTSGDADYMRMFGTGHVIRYNMFYGTKYGPGGDIASFDVAHTDGIQFYANNGDVLRDCIIEFNFFTDFFQGMFISDEQNNQSIRNVYIRDNVLWGTDLPNGSGFLGRPSWGICIGKNNGATNVRLENNLIYHVHNATAMRGGLVDGYVGGNILYGNSTNYQVYSGDIERAGDFTGDPQFRNVKSPLGPDGIFLTDDDGWYPMNSQANGFGPRIDGAPLPPPPANLPPVTNDDVVTVMQGETNVFVNVLANDSDPENSPMLITAAYGASHGGTVTTNGAAVFYTPASSFFGVETFLYDVTDGTHTVNSQVTATVTEVVIVPPPPDPDPEPEPEPEPDFQTELDALRATLEQAKLDIQLLIDLERMERLLSIAILEQRIGQLEELNIQQRLNALENAAPGLTVQQVKDLINSANIVVP